MRVYVSQKIKGLRGGSERRSLPAHRHEKELTKTMRNVERAVYVRQTNVRESVRVYPPWRPSLAQRTGLFSLNFELLKEEVMLRRRTR